VLKQGIGVHPFLGVFLQQFFYEVSCVVRYGRGELQEVSVDVFYLLDGLLSADVVEGSLADQKFKGEDAQAPQVDAHVVFAAFEDLRGRVVEGAAVSAPPFAADGCPAEVTQFCHSAGQHYVLWLYVSVGYAVVVKILDCLANLLYYLRCFWLFERG